MFAGHQENQVSPINHVYCRKIVEYLNRHFNERVSIGHIAGDIGLNPQYMRNLFKITTGDTIVTFLNRIRAEKAKELLIQSDRRISDMCRQLGFENEQYFSRVFRKHQGTSPGRFRLISLNNLNNRKYIVVTKDV